MTTIKFHNSGSKPIKGIINNILGNEVEVEMKISNKEIIFDRSTFPAGLYFFQLLQGNQMQSVPFIIDR